MKVTYLEHYPHYLGTMDTRVDFNIEDLMLLATIASAGQDPDYEFDSDDDVDELARAVTDGKGCAFDNLLTGDIDISETAARKAYWTRIWKALATKGYWAGEWEEGSFALAMPGKSRDAINALARIEAQFIEDDFDF